jgi:DNA-binding IclR family transcriptional regulator
MAETNVKTVQATNNSVKILEAIWNNHGLRPTELAQELDLAKSTIHRHLVTLEKHHYLVNEGGTYYIGLKFLNLGLHAQKRKQSSIMAERWVRELSEMINEEVDFVVEEHGRAIQVYNGYEDRDTVAQDRVGEFFYLHSTAAGKAILSELPQSRIDSIIERWGLPKETNNTIASVDELREELEDVRERGYAINDEESMTGLRAVACPILRPSGAVCGSLSVTGPTYRLSLETLHQELADIVLGVKRRFERDLRT